MGHPSEAVIRHLQLTFTPAEYRSLTQQPQYQRAGQFTPHTAGNEYWDRLPLYLIARCPFCDAAYVECLDTHSLLGWKVHPGFWDFVYTSRQEKLSEAEIERRLEAVERGTAQPDEYWKSTFKAALQRAGCQHFVAVQFFVNLHGLVPKEVVYFSNQSEVPYVMPVFLPDDIKSYVVMHSLPICRVKQEKFVPSYSLYLLTYYSAYPIMLRDRRRAEKKREDHYPSMMYTWRTIKYRNILEAWDLSFWVRKGKLLWLNLEQDDLSLKAGPVEEFPYTGIEGIRKSYTYRQGKLKVDPY